MNFPIPVNLTVSQNNVPVNITVSDDTESIGLDIETQIVASVASEYEGPYTVTPSEYVQTLETDGKIMADNVSVGAIPSNYVGSAIPRRSSSDILITKRHVIGLPDQPTAIAMSGYYGITAMKDIQAGTATTPATSITANPTVTVDSNGLVTASVSASQSVTPTVNEGYVMSGTAGTVSVQGSNTLQLNTQAAATITPTESEQTAVASGKYTTGDVKVAAIPSDYIGSEVPQKSSSDMTASGATVTAPAGYYAEAASKTIPNATWKNASTVGVVPEISVDGGGLITANCAGWTSIHPLTASGYADSDTAANIQLSGVKTSQLPTQAAQTITPTTADQTIASGKYLTGAQTVKGDANLIAENIKKDVTIFGVAGSLTSVQPMKFGVIRPDAELLQSYTYDKLLVSDNVGTWPAYSTTNKTLLSSANLSPTITMSYEDYHYYVLERMYVYPIYNTNSVGAGREEYHFSSLCYEIAQVQENTFNAMNGTPYGTRVFTVSGEPVGRLIYWTSSSAMAGYNGTGQGLMINPVAPTASSGVLTIKSPSVTVKGGATYLSSTYFGAVTDCRIQYIIEVYRVSNESDLIGWGNTQQLLRMASCINSSSHTLT